ncbi:MAG: hypothetical protein IKO15_04235 [Clostridiales bacterium]|nr:hypothetical protein [Clostridiales bacterium]
MRFIRNNRRGTVSLEAAISFSLTLVFIAAIISSIQYYRTDILMRRSVEQTCEKMSLLYPASVPATDTISVALNAFPDLGSGDMKGDKVLSNVVSVATGLDDISGHTIEELILKGVFAQTMENQIMEAYIERNGGSTFFAPDDIEVFFNINDDHHIIEVTTEYSVVTIVGVKERSIYSVIPLYGDPILMLQGEESSKHDADEEKDPDVWSMSNFDRGDAIREVYGANLPKTFPVIDSYESGDVTAIRSIDLTSPYYQDLSHIEKKIKDDIKALGQFEPQSANINGTVYRVDYIDSRYLKIVIPENSGVLSKEKVDELKGYAFVQGVILEVDEYGTSEKYISE